MRDDDLHRESTDAGAGGARSRAVTDADELFSFTLRTAYPWESPEATDLERLARRVERLHRRRRAARRTIGCVAYTLAATIGLTIVLPRSVRQAQSPSGAGGESAEVATPGLDTVPDQALAATRLETARLRAEADLRARIAKLIAATARRQDASPADIRPTEDPLASVQRELNAAGLTLVRQADEMARNEALVAVAAAWYRRTIDRFPGTPAADLARQRLGRLTPGTG